MSEHEIEQGNQAQGEPQPQVAPLTPPGTEAQGFHPVGQTDDQTAAPPDDAPVADEATAPTEPGDGETQFRPSSDFEQAAE